VVNCEAEGVTAETFDSFCEETFVTYLSNGNRVELLEGGKNIPVTFETRHEYARLVLQARVDESKRQVE
jgi:hypothetical protein